MLSTHIYNDIYTKLHQLIPNLSEDLQNGTAYGKSQSAGFMDLHLDYVGTDAQGAPIIALSHYYKENGDMVPDPDMQIRIFPELQAAEAMTFQDRWVFQEVYERHEGKQYLRPKLKEDLNIFLSQWLTNCIEQGHRIDINYTKEIEPAADQEPEQLRKQNIESPDHNQTLTR